MTSRRDVGCSVAFFCGCSPGLDLENWASVHLVCPQVSSNKDIPMGSLVLGSQLDWA